MKVKVYTTPHCPYCEKVKKFLEAGGAEVEMVDVSDRQEWFFEHTGQMSVPVTEYNGKMVMGYSERKLSKLLIGV